MKTFYFMAGLPRSGSTLISSILNQNPDIYASANSPMCSTCQVVERHILLSEQHRAFNNIESIPVVINGILQNYYSNTDKKIIIDKCRDWSCKQNFDLLLRNLDTPPKIIITVRDILDIIASFINLANNNGPENFIDIGIKKMNEERFYRNVDDTRADFLMKKMGIIDVSLQGIKNAMEEENNGHFHFVEYNDLISNPEKTINSIYDFLEIDRFNHNFKNIVNVTKEDDSVYGLEGMHDVRKTISKSNTDYKKTLSEYVINAYGGLEFWRK